MRLGLILAASVACAAMLGGSPAHAALAPVQIQAAPVANPGMVQQAAYWWHGRRYWHRRWAPRRFYHGVWIGPRWTYY